MFLFPLKGTGAKVVVEFNNGLALLYDGPPAHDASFAENTK
jgi:hypothetical protein